ncbi:MAG: YbbR-like domain-containing protein [Planctomycetota bacterium]
MKWLGSFILGLFTRHLGTKAMALLLAFVVYVIVLEQLSGTRELERLTLVFELGEELQDEYVLLDRVLVLENLKLHGPRKTLDPQANLLGQADERLLNLNADELQPYMDNKIIIVDEDFFRAMEIVGADIVVSNLPNTAFIRFDRLTGASLTLALADGMKENLTVEPDNEWEGTLQGGRLIDYRIVPSSLELRGPASYIKTRGGTLEVDIGKVDDFLRRYKGNGEPRIPVTGFNWAKAKISAAGLAHLWVLDGATPVNELKVFLEFDVVPRRKEFKIDLPIHYNVGKEGMQFLKDNYECIGPRGPIRFDQSAFEDAVCGDFVLEVEAALKPEELKTLILVLDVANRRQEGEDLVIPVRLRAAPDLLARVRIKMSLEATGEPAVVFTPKPE